MKRWLLNLSQIVPMGRGSVRRQVARAIGSISAIATVRSRGNSATPQCCLCRLGDREVSEGHSHFHLFLIAQLFIKLAGTSLATQ